MNGELWERQEGETLLWFRRFEQFKLMESVRSIAAVFQGEQGENKGGKESTKPPGRWYEMAKKWRWEERAVAWDAHIDEQIERTILAERKKVLRSRYALQHKRIETLDCVAQKLIEYLDDEDNVWLPDVKAIGTGPHARQVDIVHFNNAIFGEIRNYLGDIAAEMGERVKKNETAITSLPGNVYIGFNPDEEEGNEE